jgi:hypothetical protein
MNKIQLKAKAFTIGLQRELFEAVAKRFVNETVLDHLADYPNSDTVVEMMQSVIDRYDDAVDTLTNKIIITDNAFRHFEDTASAELDLNRVINDQVREAIKRLAKSLNALESSAMQDPWEVKHDQAQAPYSTLRIRGDFKLHSLEGLFNMATVHKYFKVYVDGCLLCYGQDYEIDLQDDVIIVNFESDITPGSNVILEALKNTLTFS